MEYAIAGVCAAVVVFKVLEMCASRLLRACIEVGNCHNDCVGQSDLGDVPLEITGYLPTERDAKEASCRQ